MPTKLAVSKNAKPKFKRVLIKVSGEALMGEQPYGQDLGTIQRICQDIKQVIDMGVEVCIVVGGGNIFRGIKGAAAGMERSSADYKNKQTTKKNTQTNQKNLEQMGVATRVQSALEMQQVAESYIRRRAILHLD